MSNEPNEPVAKRTRQSLSLQQDELNKSTAEVKQKVKDLYGRMMVNYSKITNSLPQMTERMKNQREVLMMQKCLGCSKPVCDCMSQQFQLEHNYKEMCDKVRTLQKELWNSKLLMDDALLDDLHSCNCIESEECLLRMQRMLKKDPLSLERKQFVNPNRELSPELAQFRCSPLHHAIRAAHVKCVKFLLERGASVASITTDQNYTVLQTLYDPFLWTFEPDRFDMLKLLIKYGVSDTVRYKQSGRHALHLLPITTDNIEEFSLFFEHGASMDREDARAAVVAACEGFLLDLLKLFLLSHPIRLNFGPGSYVLCQKFIERCYYSMVLPGVPSNEYHQKLLEALKFYKTFGGKFRRNATESSSDWDLMQFLKSYKHRRHFSDIESEIKALVSNPLSLQEISRLAVRKCIRKNYVESVKELPLPEELQSFLSFDDVTITELPEEFQKYGDEDYHSSGEDEDDAN